MGRHYLQEQSNASENNNGQQGGNQNVLPTTTLPGSNIPEQQGEIKGADYSFLCAPFHHTGKCNLNSRCPFQHIRKGAEHPIPDEVCLDYLNDVCKTPNCMKFHALPIQLMWLQAAGKRYNSRLYLPEDYMLTRNPRHPREARDLTAGRINMNDEHSGKLLQQFERPFEKALHGQNSKPAEPPAYNPNTIGNQPVAAKPLSQSAVPAAMFADPAIANMRSGAPLPTESIPDQSRPGVRFALIPQYMAPLDDKDPLPQNSVRLFFGQLSYAANPEILSWLIFEITGMPIKLYDCHVHKKRIGGQKTIPTGCISCHVGDSKTAIVIRDALTTKGALFDTDGVWIGEDRKLFLKLAADMMSIQEERRLKRVPFKPVSVELATATLRAVKD